MPLFTIITATYNAASTLSQLLDSLAEQTCRDFNLIIQDGASTDATTSIAQAYRDKLPQLLLESAVDTGIYDAWNKAIIHNRDHLGEWILFLGADDTLSEKDVFKIVGNKLSNAHADINFACGDICMVADDGKILDKFIFVAKDADRKIREGIMPTPHSALFTNKRVFSHYLFSSQYKIAGDFDFICNTWDSQRAFALKTTITHMGTDGISNSPFTQLKTRFEYYRIVKNKFGYYHAGKPFWCLVKGTALYAVYRIFGEKYGPKILDALRMLRGLPPHWEKISK